MRVCIVNMAVGFIPAAFFCCAFAGRENGGYRPKVCKASLMNILWNKPQASTLLKTQSSI